MVTLESVQAGVAVGGPPGEAVKPMRAVEEEPHGNRNLLDAGQNAGPRPPPESCVRNLC